jgi:hypothetical protein
LNKEFRNRASGVAKVIEHLPSKYKAPISSPSTKTDPPPCKKKKETIITKFLLMKYIANRSITKE